MDNHYAASLAAYSIVAIVYSVTTLRNARLSKELVDFFYYAIGIFSVVLFTWVHTSELRKLDLPRGLTLQQATEQNSEELIAAFELSKLFHNDDQALVDTANAYLRKMWDRSPKFRCVQDYREYESAQTGIILIDPAAVLIRREADLDLEAPLQVVRECVKHFGGEPVRTSLLTFWKRGKLATFDSEAFSFSAISNSSQFNENLHVFMALKVPEHSMELAEYIEYLVGNDGAILTPAEIKNMANSRALSAEIKRTTWFDNLLTQLTTEVGALLEFAIWPFVAVFLLSLKIATIWRKR
jgi:hypothetical protein